MSESYKFTGRVVHVGSVETVGQSNFQKCDVIVCDDDPDYPQEVPFVFAGKKADLPHEEQISEGDSITIHFGLRGRKWKDRWFGENGAWKLEVHTRTESDQQPAPDGDHGDDDEMPAPF